MRRHLIMIVAIALVLALVSCTNDSGMNPGGSTLTLRAAIGTDAASVSETFSAGDAVTILINGSKYTYTVSSDGKLSSEIPYYFDSPASIKVQGIYPAIDSIQDNSFTWEIETDQSTKEAYESSDLLVSSVTEVSLENKNASLAFYHQAARIVINVKESDFLIANTLSSVKINDVAITGEYTLPTGDETHGTWTVQSGNSGSITPREIDIPADGCVVSYEAIVIPQTIASGKELFEFNVGEYSPFYYNVPSNGIEWKAGDEYVYNITLNYDSGYTDDGNGNYTVTTADGLKHVAKLVNNGEAGINITLDKNIDLTGIDWMPIGNEKNLYAGTFDGNNKTITGLTINQTSESNVGLFASIDKGGTVKNLTLDKVNITADYNIGAVAGENRGTIENCSVSGSVTDLSDNSYVGGIAGWNNSGIITDCHSSATVKGMCFAGGIAGQNNASITACYSTGSVTATKNNTTGYSYAGGVVGLNNNGAILTACYATGEVKGEGQFVGGVVGDNVVSIIAACYHANGSVNGASGTTGGVAGQNSKDDYSSGILNACYWDGSVTGDKGIGNDMTGNSASDALKVSGRTTWAEAMGHMNSVLTGLDTGWKYVTGSGDVPLTLQKN